MTCRHRAAEGVSAAALLVYIGVHIAKVLSVQEVQKYLLHLNYTQNTLGFLTVCSSERNSHPYTDSDVQMVEYCGMLLSCLM